MCGIAGFIHLDGTPADPVCLQAMTDAQQHRGPDDQGLALFSLHRGTAIDLPIESSLPPPDPSLEGGLGFNRLSILDLSANGHQPMRSHDDRVLMAYNGEVYNAFDYRDELAAAGYPFRSHTDTEILLALYQQVGLDGMLARLNGMFAMCLVDLERACLVIARDPLGIKPIYWARTGQTVLFASEVKSFLRHPDFQAEIDEERLDELLALRFCAGAGHPLRGVHQLPPGHVLTLSPSGMTIRPYWSLPEQESPYRGSLTEASHRLEHLLHQSVHRQLLSDVPLGSQLSGGIDSSLVTWSANHHHQAQLESFSVVFQDPAFSEEPWMDEVATRCGTENHRFPFEFDQLPDRIQTATWHLDQPLHVPNTLGIHLLAEHTKPHVTVLLSGEGADELLGGYPRYADELLRSFLERFTRGWPGIGPALRQRLRGQADPGTAGFVNAMLSTTPTRIRSLRPGLNLEQVLAPRRTLFQRGEGDLVTRCTRYDLQTYLVDLLMRQDKMTMAYGIENRVPFLDLDLVTFARSLPSRYLAALTLGPKQRRYQHTKRVLKDQAERVFGRRFAYRRKSGFPLPLEACFKRPEVQAWMEDRILPGLRRRGWIESAPVEQAWRQEDTASTSRLQVLWSALTLESWAQLFIDAPRR